MQFLQYILIYSIIDALPLPALTVTVSWPPLIANELHTHKLNIQLKADFIRSNKKNLQKVLHIQHMNRMQKTLDGKLIKEM